MKKVDIFILDITRMGGTERAVINLYNILKVIGIEVRIISISGLKNIRPYYTFEGIDKIDYLECVSLQRKLYYEIKWLYSFWKRLCNMKLPQDAILLGTGHNINFVLALYKLFRWKKNKVVAWEHIQLATIPKNVRIMMKFVYSYLDAIVVLSHFAKKELETHLSINKQVYVIPNSIPFNNLCLSNVENKRIIMVGRLSKEKGYERVIPIAKFLEKKYPEWKIEILGSGPLEKELLQEFRNSSLNNVRLNGAVKNIVNEYLKSSILMMTSYTEVMPMVILEANACGVPVIAYECGGTQELIVDGVNGFLIKDGDFVDYCDKVGLLISDDSLRKKLSKESYELSKKYSQKGISVLWENLFTDIL